MILAAHLTHDGLCYRVVVLESVIWATMDLSRYSVDPDAPAPTPVVHAGAREREVWAGECFAEASRVLASYQPL